jgi:4-oxalocrotonate tautomerase
MPFVTVKVWEGFGAAKAKKAIQGITKVLVEMDIPQRAVSVVVQEIPKTHWGVGGEPASEKVRG